LCLDFRLKTQPSCPVESGKSTVRRPGVQAEEMADFAGAPLFVLGMPQQVSLALERSPFVDYD